MAAPGGPRLAGGMVRNFIINLSQSRNIDDKIPVKTLASIAKILRMLCGKLFYI